MNLTDFVSDMPMPPPFPKGGRKPQTTCYFTEQEDDLINYLVSRLPALYDRSKYQLIRHAVYNYIYELEPLVDTDWKPVVQELKDKIRHSNYLTTREAIAELLDMKANSFNLLLDFGEVDGALAEYDKFLDEMVLMPDHWRRVIATMETEHPEMDRFHNRVEKLGLEWSMALKEVIEKPR